MAVTFCPGGRLSNVASVNNFSFTGGNYLFSGSSVEANCRVTARVAGTFSGLKFSVNNTGTGRTLQFRKNGANGNQVATATDATSGIYAATGSDHVAVGDTFGYQFTGSSATYTPYYTSMKFLADAGTKAYATTALISFGGAISSGIIAVGSFSVQSQSLAVGSASSTFSAKRIFRNACTVNNFVIGVAQVSSAQVTVTSQLTSSAGKCSITYSSNVTGIFEDTTNTDTLASGDEYSFITTLASSGDPRFQLGANITYTTAQSELFCTGLITGGSASGFMPLFTTNAQSATTPDETASQVTLGEDGTLSRMRLWAALNSNSTSQTFRLRKNGANANQTITVGGALTGTFEDTTNTDTFVTTDALNWSYSSYSGGVQIWGMGMTVVPVDYIRGYPEYEPPRVSREIVSY